MVMKMEVNMKEKISMGKKKRWIAVCVVGVIVCAGIFSFIKLRNGKKTVNAGNMKQTTVSLSKMDLVESVSATGTIESAKSKNVSASVSNVEVKKVLVSVGDKVKKGDSLVKFDVSALEDALSDAKDNLEDTKTSADNEVANAQTQLSNASDTYSESVSNNAKSVSKAKSSLKSIKKQVKSLKSKIKKAKDKQEKASLQQELTQLEEKLEQAQSTYEQAVSNQTSGNRQNKSSVSSAKSALEQAQSNRTKQIKEAQKQVKQAQENLDKCAVTAPMSGTVTSISVEEGDVYSGGTLLQIQKTNSFIVTTSVDEYDIGDVEEGQRVVILTEATDEDELEGEVTFVAPSTDSSSSTNSSADNGQMTTSSSGSSGGYEVKIKVATKDKRLKLGMTAKCSIVKSEAEDVFAVPYDAIRTENNESYILVKDSGTETEKKISVTKGMESDYYTEISGDGLEEGMSVIIPSDKIDETSDSSTDKDDKAKGLSGFGGGGMPDGNSHGGPGGEQGGGNGNGGSFPGK